MNATTERKLTEALEHLANAATLLENLDAAGLLTDNLDDDAQGDVTAAQNHADMGAQRLAAVLYR